MQTYGVCLDEAMEGRYTAPFVASLALQLPQDCRWRVSYDRDLWWTGDRMLAANLLNQLMGLIWGLSDKGTRGQQPKPVGPSWARGERKSTAVVMTPRQLLAELRKPRRGEENVG